MIKLAGSDNRYHIPKVMQLQTYLDFVEQIELGDEMYRSSAPLEQVEYYNQDDICVMRRILSVTVKKNYQSNVSLDTTATLEQDATMNIPKKKSATSGKEMVGGILCAKL